MTRVYLFALILIAIAAEAFGQAACREDNFWVWMRETSPTDNYVLTYDASSDCAQWEASAGGGGSPGFDDITTATNTTATMTCGTGCAVTTSGSGSITATDVSCSTCVTLGTETSGQYLGWYYPGAGLDVTGIAARIQECSTNELVRDAGTLDWDCTTGFEVSSSGEVSAVALDVGSPGATRGLLQIEGTGGDSGPNIAAYVSADTTYPTLHLYSVAHDDVGILLDAYETTGSGTTSADAGSNYGIIKTGDELRIIGNTGTSAGSGFTATDLLVFDTSGNAELAGELAIGDTGTVDAGMLKLEGTDASLADGPHIELRVSSVTQGPVMHIYAEDGGAAVLWGAERTKAVAGFGDLSTNSTANFAIRQKSDELYFLSDAGITAGNDLVWDVAMWIDAGAKTINIGSPSADTAGIQRVLADETTVDVASVSANSCLDGTTITVTGAADGDPCFVGVTDDAADTTGLQFTCYVSAASTVTIRACNSTGTGQDPPSGTYSVVVYDLN